MLKNYLKVAFRDLRRYKGYTLLNVGGLTVALTAVLLIFLYVADELSFDCFHREADRIYRVVWQEEDQGMQTAAAITPDRTARLLKDNVPEVEDAVRFWGYSEMLVQWDDNVFSEDHLVFADSNFFDFFSYRFLVGDARTALKQPYSAVLTEELAARYFGREDPLGKELHVSYWGGAAVYTVTGLIENVPTNSGFSFKGVLSQNFNEEDQLWQATFVRLQRGVPIEAVQPKLDVLSQEIMSLSYAEVPKVSGVRVGYALQPLTAIHLPARNTKEWMLIGNPAYVWTLFVIGLFILLLACVNYVNLSTARATTRAREVGIRKVVGASIQSLVAMLSREFVVLVFAAFILAVPLAYLGVSRWLDNTTVGWNPTGSSAA